MTTKQLYDKAINNGFDFIGNCTQLDGDFVYEQVQKAKVGNQVLIQRLIKNSEYFGMMRDAVTAYNPWKHLITDEYIIVIHSGIEYFFKVRE